MIYYMLFIYYLLPRGKINIGAVTFDIIFGGTSDFTTLRSLVSRPKLL